MLEQCRTNSKQRRNNVATLCCAKNRRCKSSQVTSRSHCLVYFLARRSGTLGRICTRRASPSKEGLPAFTHVCNGINSEINFCFQDRGNERSQMPPLLGRKPNRPVEGKEEKTVRRLPLSRQLT